MPAMIVLGDQTDHGGAVIEASGVTDTHGKYIARVGDRVTCPKKGHRDVVIIEGDNTMIIDGRAVAYDGCMTSCGARLIAGQSLATVDFGGGAGASQGSAHAPAAKTASAVTAATSYNADTGPDNAIFDEQFELRDAEGNLLVEMPYTVKFASGEVAHGETDASGKTKRYTTDGPQRLELYLGHT